jgi:tRNA 2-thiouridine synthesizing protein E
MAIEVNGKSIETTASGFLENIEEWSEDLAKIIADDEKLELTDRHWDVVNYLRDEFINNAGNQPNTRNMVKAMSKLWGDKSVNAKTLYDLFPGDPSKQGGRIGGLPESRRKGGY